MSGDGARTGRIGPRYRFFSTHSRIAAEAFGAVAARGFRGVVAGRNGKCLALAFRGAVGGYRGIAGSDDGSAIDAHIRSVSCGAYDAFARTAVLKPLTRTGDMALSIELASPVVLRSEGGIEDASIVLFAPVVVCGVLRAVVVPGDRRSVYGE